LLIEAFMLREKKLNIEIYFLIAIILAIIFKLLLSKYCSLIKIAINTIYFLDQMRLLAIY